MRAVLFVIVFLFSISAFSQKKYLVEMSHSSNLPDFTYVNGSLVYNGSDIDEEIFFNKYSNFRTDRMCPNSQRENVLKFMLVETDNVDFINDLLKKFPDKYLRYQDITDIWRPQLMNDSSSYSQKDYEYLYTDNQILANNYPNISPYYPNDYTTVSVQSPTDYSIYDSNDLKYINAPIAWGITNGGSSDIKIGVSDAKVMPNDIELNGKVSFLPSGDPYANLSYDPCVLDSTHGTETAVAIAGRGDNNHGVLGVCYECEVIVADYDFCEVLELAKSGVRIINMSWGHYSYLEPSQYLTTCDGEFTNNIIQEIVEDYGTILVASAGNHQYFDYTNSIDNAELIPRYNYPACFENVISVSSLQHWYDLNNHPISPPWSVCYQNQQVLPYVEDSIGFGIRVDVTPPVPLTYSCDNGGAAPPTELRSHLFNEQVDILAPSHYVSYARLQYGFCPTTMTKYGNGTSHSAPLVSGTIGLMLSEDICLTADETEDILKLSSKPVEHLSFNSLFVGLSGAGALQAGNAVAFVHEMNKSNGTVIVKNQSFNRYELSAKRILNNLVLEDVKFIDNSIAEFKSGNEINLLEGTLLEPGSNESYILLEVGDVDNQCGGVVNKTVGEQNISKNKPKEVKKIDIFPTLVVDNVTIRKNLILNDNEGGMSIMIFNVLGVNVFELTNFNNKESIVNLNHLKSGVYIVKVLDSNKNVIHTQKIIKK